MSAKLGELLVREGQISADQLEAALEHQRQHGRKIGECLVRLGFISEHYILVTLAAKYRLPIVDLARVGIDEQAARLLPARLARQHRCIPIRRARRRLTVAMADPIDVSVIDEIRFITGCDIEAALSTTKDIVNAIVRVYTSKMSGEETDTINELVAMDDWELQYPELGHEEGGRFPPLPAAFGVLFVDSMLKNAIRRGASHIYVEPYHQLFRVRFRIDGMLKTVFQWQCPYFGSRERKAYSAINRLRLLAGITVPPGLAGDGRIRIALRTPALERQINFEVSCLPTLYGTRIVLRPCEEEAHRVSERSQAGTELSSTDLFPGWTKERKEWALIAAAQRGQNDVVRALLLSGASACARRRGLTALMAAAQKGQAKVVQELLEGGADASAEDSGMTALRMAAFNGYVDTVSALLDHASTDLSFCSEQVLSRAAMEGNEAMIRLLVGRRVVGAEAALCAACEYGRTEIIQWLLRRGPVDTTKALEVAARWGQAEPLQVLVDHEAQKVSAKRLNSAVETLTEGWDATALYGHPNILWAATRGVLWREVRRVKASYLATLKLLLEAGADVKAIDPSCVASLARRRGGGLLRVFFEAGVRIPLELQEEMLLFAVQTADGDTLSALLEADVPVGAEALRWMMGDDRRELLRLVRDKEDVKWKEDEKDRALMWADYYGHSDIADRLIKAGATMPGRVSSAFDERRIG